MSLLKLFLFTLTVTIAVADVSRWSGVRCEMTTDALQNDPHMSCYTHCRRIPLPKFDYGHCRIHNYFGECECLASGGLDMTES